MKRIILGILACLALFGCGDDKKQEKALLDSVIKIHDKVMMSDDKLMKNKMLIDTLLKTKLTGDTAAKKDTLVGFKVQLTNAEDAMEKWMQTFNPETKGKSHQDIMNYFGEQKAQIMSIDSSINEAVGASGKYLKTIQQ